MNNLTKDTFKNGNFIRISTITLLFFLLAAFVFFSDRQLNVDAAQNVQIEKKVDEKQYIRDIDRIERKLDKILEWVMP